MPRCKHCRELFDNTDFLQKFCRTNIDCQTAEGMYNLEKRKKKEQKDWNKKKESLRPFTHGKENKVALQSEINKLSRLIDAKFGYVNCIDCGTRLDNIDAGHYISVGSNSTLRFNLHNIHAQKRGCNRNERQGSRNTGYYKGLIKRYGKEYADYVDNTLQNEYEYLGITSKEVHDKLKVVRSLIRNFDTFSVNDSIHARDTFNTIIGIYQTQYKTNGNTN